MPEFKDIFISYGRKESLAFASKLFKTLKDSGYDAWFDYVNIPKGDDFQLRIDNGIESAHNFVYIISPHANNSEFCRKEIELAIKLKKRIIPVLHVERSLDKLHPELGKINWIYSREQEDNTIPIEEWKPIDDFDVAFSDLIAIINTDKEYVFSHTEILDRALEWDKGHHAVKHLLVGKDRKDAEQWLLSEFKPPAQPPCIPSELHCEYICASRKNGENLMTDAFVCYDVDDKNIRDQVKRSLARFAVTTWTHDKDIEKGADYGKAIEEGIEQADNFLFFISPKSIASKYCLKELEYAASLNKRIIPLLIEPTDVKKFPELISKLQYIDFTDNIHEEDYFQDIDDILNEFNKDNRYYEQHKVFLTQALKWETQEHNQSILLRGYNLQNAQAWLKIGKKRKLHKPTKLHEDFIKESTEHSGEQNIEVFVSYSRTDGDFARKLNEELQLSGKTTWFDQESIAEGSDFQTEIYKGIEASDNFLFIISPDAVSSEFCADEVEYAAKLNKRFITLNYRDTDPGSMPEALSAVQWIDFKGDFHASFSQLLRTLDVDREHVQSHTKWQQRAMEWNTKDRGNDLLLRGNEFAIAKAWLDEALDKEKKPVPTKLQKVYLEESNKAIQALIAKEKNTIAKLRGLLIAASIALIAAIAGGVFAYHKSVEAEKAFIQAQKESERNEKLFKQANQAKRVAKREAKRATKALDSLAKKEEALQDALIVAEEKENQAKISAIKANLSKIKAERSQKQAELAKIIAEKESRANREAALALQIEKKDPTLAMRVIGRVYQENKSPGIEQIIYDFYNEHEFYSHNLPDHGDNIYTVAISPDGETLITGGRDSKARLWDKNGKIKYTFTKHSDTVLDAVFSPDGKYILTGSYDKTAKLWTLDGNIELTLGNYNEPIWAVSFSPDGKKIITGDNAGFVRIWDLKGNELRSVSFLNEEINDLDFSPDGKYILVAPGQENAIMIDTTGAEIRRFTHSDMIMSAKFSPDGTKVLTGSWDRTTKLWDFYGTELKTFETDYTRQAIFSSTGNKIIVASNNRTITIWSLDGKLLKTLKGHSDAVIRVAISPDDQSIISGSWDHTAKIWHLVGEEFAEFSYNGRMHATTVSPNSRAILIPSKDTHEVKLLSVSGYEIATFSGHTNIVMATAFSPSGDTILTAGWDGYIKIWSEDGTELKNIYESGSFQTVNYSPSGKYFAASNSNHELLIYHVNNLDNPIRVKAHEKDIFHINFSVTGDSILTVSDDKIAKIWNPQGKELKKFDSYGYGIFQGSFSPDGKHLLLAGKDNTAKIYDFDDNLVHSFKGHSSYVISANFSPDGKSVVTSSTDREIKIWDPKGKIIKTFSNHKSIVNDAFYAPNGKFILSASADGVIYLRFPIMNPKELLKSDKIAKFDSKYYAEEGVDMVNEYLKSNTPFERVKAAKMYFDLANDTEEISLRKERFKNSLEIYENIIQDKNYPKDSLVEIYKYAGHCNEWIGSINEQLNKDNLGLAVPYELKAINYYDKMCKISNNPEDYIIKANEYKDLSIIYSNAGNLNESLNAQNQNIKIREKVLNEYSKYLSSRSIKDQVKAINTLASDYNDLATSYFNNSMYKEAVTNKYREVRVRKNILTKYPNYEKLNSIKNDISNAISALGAYQIYNRQYINGEKSALEALEFYPDYGVAKIVLARAYLFSNRYENAKSIYLELKDVSSPFSELPTYKDLALNQFSEMEKAGLKNNNIIKIKRLLMTPVEQLESGLSTFQDLLALKSAEKLIEAAEYFDAQAGIAESFEEKAINYKKSVDLYERAIKIGVNDYTKIIAGGVYYSLAWSQLYNKKFSEVEIAVLRGAELGADESIYTYLPLAYLFTDRVEKAKTFYKEWKDKSFDENTTYRSEFLKDLEQLEKKNITNSKISEIREILTESNATNFVSSWTGIPFSDIEAAVYWPPTGYIYMFKDDQYIRVDPVTNEMTEGGYPYKTSVYWPGVNFDKIDAITYWKSNNKSYIFRGNQYMRYDIDQNKVDPGYPKEINEYNWPGLTFTQIDAAVTLPNGKCYFFSGDKYIRYDTYDDHADPGYPKKISNLNWYGLDLNKIDAALIYTTPNLVFFEGEKVDNWVSEK